MATARQRLTASDFDFIAAAISREPNPSLVELLTDHDALDAALESDRLLKALLESPHNVSVSPQLYFYVLSRHMLRGFDRSISDYVAHVLMEFIAPQQVLPVPVMSDMLVALQSASTDRAFQIRVHVGDTALFLSGVLPQHIHERAVRRGAPEIGFYEDVGATSYRMASEHRLAQKSELAETYRTMAEHFSEVRVGLNHMADRLLCLEKL